MYSIDHLNLHIRLALQNTLKKYPMSTFFITVSLYLVSFPMRSLKQVSLGLLARGSAKAQIVDVHAKIKQRTCMCDTSNNVQSPVAKRYRLSPVKDDICTRPLSRHLTVGSEFCLFGGTQNLQQLLAWTIIRFRQSQRILRPRKLGSMADSHHHTLHIAEQDEVAQSPPHRPYPVHKLGCHRPRLTPS